MKMKNTENTVHVMPWAHATTNTTKSPCGHGKAKPNKKDKIKKKKFVARKKTEILAKAATSNQFLKADFGTSTSRWRKFKSLSKFLIEET